MRVEITNDNVDLLYNLPDGVTELYCNGLGLTELPELPLSLEKLYCSDNKLVSLPKLPNTLEYLYCSDNNLVNLSELPDRLKELYCTSNDLVSLPELPKTLKSLFCYENKLISLPELPKLPNNLTTLDCHNNPFEYPISKEIVDKFKLNNKELYTPERISIFKTLEWQKHFLTDYPERFMDIDWLVLDEIRDEFSYLYDANNLGIF